MVAFSKSERVLITSVDIYKNRNHRKQFGRKILSNEFLGFNILMPLVVIKSSLTPVKSYIKFNQGSVQKIDTENKSQDIYQKLTVTSGHQIFLEIFAGFLKTQQ